MSGPPERPAAEDGTPPTERQHTGLSMLDLERLPPAQRKVWRLILRDIQMAHPALLEAIDALPEAERPSREQVHEALEELLKQGWISREGENPVVYKVVVRRKSTGVLTQPVKREGRAKLASDVLATLGQEEQKPIEAGASPPKLAKPDRPKAG